MSQIARKINLTQAPDTAVANLPEMVTMEGQRQAFMQGNAGGRDFWSLKALLVTLRAKQDELPLGDPNADVIEGEISWIKGQISALECGRR